MDEIRRFSVHLAPGGAVSDVLLWRKFHRSVTFLLGSTAIWFLFEVAGYNLLSLNVLLLLIAILYTWAKSASLLNRPLPPLPNLEVSEDTLVKAANDVRVWVNYVLPIAHDIAIGGNLRLFSQVVIGLWVISYLGSFFHFLTLVYIGVLLSLSLPIFYEKYQDPIDETLSVAYNIAQLQYHTIDDKILQKIPLLLNKEKKTK